VKLADGLQASLGESGVHLHQAGDLEIVQYLKSISGFVEKQL
jgi:hypothetical protein